MANKADMYYFKTLQESAQCACDAAEYLVECLTNYNPSNINEMLEKMHECENRGDIKRHELSEALAKAFVTPIDREDIALISQNIDNVIDDIEEILQKIYMCKIKEICPDALVFSKKLCSCCTSMHEMLCEFVNFKKPAKLHELTVQISNIEEECDKLYIESYRSLDEHYTNPLDIMSWREILESMERCADACEHVGDSIDMVVMKNS